MYLVDNAAESVVGGNLLIKSMCRANNPAIQNIWRSNFSKGLATTADIMVMNANANNGNTWDNR